MVLSDIWHGGNSHENSTVYTSNKTIKHNLVVFSGKTLGNSTVI